MQKEYHHFKPSRFIAFQLSSIIASQLQCLLSAAFIAITTGAMIM